MKNLIFGFFLIMFVLQSCNKDDEPITTCENCDFTCLDMNELDVITNDCIDNWECDFKVTPQSTIDLDEFDGKGSGDKNVFQMINHTEGSLAIADDEYTNILVFELDESQSSFSLENDELENIQVHYKVVCFCIDVSFKPVNSGCMQGEKQADGTWLIQGNLNITSNVGEAVIKLDAQFVN